ncbi:hypothetical protein EZ449_16600 [Pedobacter frigidisoli]|uniref:DUF5615 domain-containing protein n=1 Tax=Pedobacter frigidisoli TaxID=2530455 RepID=A0A4R0NZH1_9SPHI|nr:hypothetical protein EZ449_16600 [Pedobacter frigidisoli]
MAINEKRIILTFDSDYGEIILHHKVSLPPAVVYYRFKDSYPSFAGEVLIKLIESQHLIQEDRFTVIEKSNIRQRVY